MSLQRLQALQRVAENLLMPPHTNTLGFAKWECGTYACLGGHYERQTGVRIIDNDLNAPYLWTTNRDRLADHFGITTEEANSLFWSDTVDEPFSCRYPGKNAYAELEARLRKLNELISERQVPSREKIRAVA
jgi:hypothetical protein